jgi:ABC-type branched-subunit amino acid transport system ATPase component
VSKSAAQPVLEIRQLNAFYGKNQVIFDLDLHVGPGEAVAVLGRNGAGKTTALMAVAGVVTSHASTLRLAGEDISHLPSFKRVRRGLSLVPSGSRAFPNLTVDENLDLVRGGENGGARWTTEDAYRTFPKLAELKGNSAGTLSGGERQMLAVARAMLAGPRLLMLDEPSEGLAPLVVKGIADRLQAMRGQGIGILLTEQNHRLALEVADRVYFIEKGQAVWEGDATAASDPAVIGRYLSV